MLLIQLRNRGAEALYLIVSGATHLMLWAYWDKELNKVFTIK